MAALRKALQTAMEDTELGAYRFTIHLHPEDYVELLGDRLGEADLFTFQGHPMIADGSAALGVVRIRPVCSSPFVC